MLRLVSLNGENITQNLYRSHPVYPSISKYLVYIKEALGLEAEMAKLDSSGSHFELLKTLSQGRSHVIFEDTVYIPMHSKSEVWGFVKLKNSKYIDAAAIRKAVHKLQEIVPHDLYCDLDGSDNKNHLVVMVLDTQGKKGYRLVLDHFHKDKYVAFINLSEWINLKQPFSLKYLREFRNTLFYVHEFMDLTRSQRSTLALYSMLPTSIRKNALVMNSKFSKNEIKKSLASERGFLSAFLDKRIEIIPEPSP